MNASRWRRTLVSIDPFDGAGLSWLYRHRVLSQNYEKMDMALSVRAGRSGDGET